MSTNQKKSEASNAARNGLVLIDKPRGCTSHDVVNRWRRLAQTKRVGHLGTLDPMATGLLALLTGTATRLAQYFAHDEKTYRAEITLGKVSDTYDAEGEVRDTGVSCLPAVTDVVAALRSFEGISLQVPPPVSAKRVNGVRAYSLARKNIAVELTPVEVNIKEILINDVNLPHLNATITSSSGTYIRSIAHDLGQKLGCGALLSKLRRIRIGSYTVEQSRTLEELTSMAADASLAAAVVPACDLLPHMPVQWIDDTIRTYIRQGRDFRTSPFVIPSATPHVKAVDREGELIAIGELRIPNLYHPCTVL